MSADNAACLVCKKDSDEIPLISFQYKGSGLFICPQHLPIPELLEDVADDFEGPNMKPLAEIVGRAIGLHDLEE